MAPPCLPAVDSRPGLAYFENTRPVALSSAYGLGTFVSLLLTSTLLIVVISLVSSRVVTRPTRALVRYMKDLSDKSAYGSVDPSREEGDDELARIGRTVNQMSLSIANLLESNDRLNEEKRRTELSMLQMQVNPHFLYNTLESIRYLAQVHKADGIASMTRGHVRVNEVALALGFENIYYFSKVFKRVCGLSPSEWQKRQESD